MQYGDDAPLSNREDRGLAAVSYLGPAGTFTHLAARAMWGDPASLIPQATVPDVVESVLAGRANHGVIPVENTVEGVVTTSLDQLLFRTPDLVMAREVSVRITFNSYRARGAVGPPLAIASHGHGLAQCARYVASTGLRVDSFPSTAAAVSAAADNAELVAIGAAGLESQYDVEPVAAAVEDHPGAYTRFADICRTAQVGSVPAPDPDESSWKTTLALTPGSSRPGVLADVCTQFADQGLNLISLSSRPLPGFAGAYVFVTTVDVRNDSVGLARAVQGLLHTGVRVKYLGSYLSDYNTYRSDRNRSFVPPIGSLNSRDIHEFMALFPGLGGQ